MRPFTLEWWMQIQKEVIVEAELAWSKYLRDRNRVSERIKFIQKWEVAHWITDRIINKYGE